MTEKLFSIKSIKGENTKSDPIRIPRGTDSFVERIVNADLDNSGMPTRRQGSGAVLVSGSSADLYSDGSICLVRQTLNLKRLQKSGTTWSATTIMTLTSTASISYESVNHFVYLTNSSDLAVVSEGGVTRINPEEKVSDFDYYFPAGQIIRFYNGRMYMAYGNYIYISLPLDPRYIDPLDYVRYDRRDSIINLPAYITMMRPVDDGMYISTTEELFFAQGDTPEAFVPKHIADYGAIKGTDCKVDSALLPFKDVSGAAVMFRTARGIGVGMNGGAFQNISITKIADEDAAYGASLCRYNNGIQTYLVSTTT